MPSLTEQYMDALNKRKEDLATAAQQDTKAQSDYSARNLEAMRINSIAQGAWEQSNRRLAVKDPGTGPNGRDVHAAPDAYKGALSGADLAMEQESNKNLKAWADQTKAELANYNGGMQGANYNVDQIKAQGAVQDNRQARQGLGINLGANITNSGPTLANYGAATMGLAGNFYSKLKGNGVNDPGGLLSMNKSYGSGSRGLDSGLLSAMGYRDYT